MKKYLTFFILILSSLVLSACSKDPSVIYSKDTITINIGYNYVISYSDIEVQNSSSEYEIVSLDESIAQVNGYIVTPKQQGETIIRIRLVDNNAVKFDIRLIVTDIKYAKSATIENEKVYVNFSENTDVFNAVTVSENCNEVPEIIYDKSVISYDYSTGKITPLALGETSVIVLFRDCNVSFKVYVIDKIFTKSLVVNDCTIIQGYSGKFNFSVFPDNANTYNFFSLSDLLTVSSDGQYNAKNVGTATVYCEYTSAIDTAPVLLDFQVTIIDNIQSLDMEIVDIESGQKENYYLLEKKHRLRIYNCSIPSDNLSIIGNINMVSDIVSDSQGIYVDFYFKNTGENALKVDVSFDGKNVDLTQSKTCNVSTLSSVEIKVKLSIYLQSPREDGKYYVQLDNTQTSTLRFVPYIGQYELSEAMTVYDVTSGDRVVVQNGFQPTTAGEYTFEFEIMSATIGRLIVVVQE